LNYISDKNGNTEDKIEYINNNLDFIENIDNKITTFNISNGGLYDDYNFVFE